MADWNGEERRSVIVATLDKKQTDKLDVMHDTVLELKTLITHPKLGIIAKQSRMIKTIYGNGFPGLKMQTVLIWTAVALLGTDNRFVKMLVAAWWK